MYVAGWSIMDPGAAGLVTIIFGSVSGVLRNVRSESVIDWRVSALFSATVAPCVRSGSPQAGPSPERLVEVVCAILLLS